MYLSTEFLAAELDLTKDPAARKQARLAPLKVTRELEKFAAANLQHGTATQQDMLTAKAARLLAEIQILRLQDKQ